MSPIAQDESLEQFNKSIMKQIIEMACKYQPHLVGFVTEKDGVENPDNYTNTWDRIGQRSRKEMAILGFCMSVWFDLPVADLMEILEQLNDHEFVAMVQAMEIYRTWSWMSGRWKA